jgi:hypothetical protein
MSLPRINVLLINKQTATQASDPIDVSGYRYITVYAMGYGTTSGGTYLIEESVDDPATKQTFGGTWAPIGAALNASAVSAGKQIATHFTVSAYSRVRVSVATTITGGGTLSVVLVASE